MGLVAWNKDDDDDDDDDLIFVPIWQYRSQIWNVYDNNLWIKK